MRELVICSGKVNRYGFRMMPKGIRLDAYLKNPVLLVEHDGGTPSIGKMTNLHINGEGMLVGTPEFDDEDPIALTYKRKYEKGFMNACSLSADILKTSSDPTLILPGQTGESVTDSELYEISMTNLPGDRDAVGRGIELSTAVPKIKQNNITKLNKESNMDYKNIAAKLGIPATATEVEVIAAIESVQLNVSNLSASRVDALIKLGKENGSINDTNETAMRSLAKLDYANAATVVNSVAKLDTQEAKPAEGGAAKLTVQDLVKAFKGGVDKPDDKPQTYQELSATKEGVIQLRKMKEEDPEAYDLLFKASNI